MKHLCHKSLLRSVISTSTTQPSPLCAILHCQWWRHLGKHCGICTTTLQSLPGFLVAGSTFCLNLVCLWSKMNQAYWLKIKANSNTPADQLKRKMDQDLNSWRVKNTRTATWQTHNLLHNCIFNTIHHLNGFSYGCWNHQYQKSHLWYRAEGQADTPDGGCVTTQGDTNRQEKWANRNLWEFSTGKCQVLQQGKNNPMHQYIENKDFLR